MIFNWMSIKFIKENLLVIISQVALIFLTYILVRYQYRSPKSELILTKQEEEDLIRNNKIDSLTSYKHNDVFDKTIKYLENNEVSYKFVSTDIFNYNSKLDIKRLADKIIDNGIGTCGPRGFYGTSIDHIELEEIISVFHNKEAALVYSNSSAGKISTICCFVKPKHTVFIRDTANEIIKRAVLKSKAVVVYFKNYSDLINQLKIESNFKIIIIEDLSLMTGQYFNKINELCDKKEELGFRMILDVNYFSLKRLYNDKIDIIMGSLPFNGGYAVTTNDNIGYMRINAKAYVFSASLPVFLIEANKQFLSRLYKDSEFDNSKIRKFYKNYKNIISSVNSPIVVLKVSDAYKVQHDLISKEKILIEAFNKNYVRFYLNDDVTEKEIEKILNKSKD
ncbi:SPTC1 [Hepatospora eriocheir]|uniref:SPTC1 n=1 Tax=Hepatospora eriocheir TaxID=1081669 RepID=A0A1X0QCH8_9MICR|nr:SPTC1 [Hepatospora eriocheir]